jgi:hypothetical protein
MTKPHAFRHSHTEYLQEEYKKILSLNYPQNIMSQY